ncbi:hypothetical protein CLAFUW4_02357 [Fulvia fulva]|uniref:Uncharacterized protein n=1 Tax=Passalora fulva TaxID=5499 RepID=A0A9Q8LAE2_PASFU|nr:uncharacterized protein CLAFUR5_02346 [Fulvia fulva]KAK4631857.1 hypothetical protein CLAFUR4_02352 [Fulvia fulva]KAK4633486.1 hypothetical protein CLAFUR0_02356 [Fulvia fulva]UJO13865.1 hypothetical protein CLAFUR5_02346 [Fulvia fulva]WPV11025.1 hypothetical protein CLAFUW4_02357 [Fulvia fulva]WPV26739.1 hypothetical protein CLAFUW7_02357 [Fulvia fulva]
MFKVRCRYACSDKTFSTSGALRDHMRRTHNLVPDTLVPGRDYTICNRCQRKLLWYEYDKHIKHQKGKHKGEVRSVLILLIGVRWRVQAEGDDGWILTGGALFEDVLEVQVQRAMILDVHLAKALLLRIGRSRMLRGQLLGSVIVLVTCIKLTGRSQCDQ